MKTFSSFCLSYKILIRCIEVCGFNMTKYEKKLILLLKYSLCMEITHTGLVKTSSSVCFSAVHFLCSAKLVLSLHFFIIWSWLTGQWRWCLVRQVIPVMCLYWGGSSGKHVSAWSEAQTGPSLPLPPKERDNNEGQGEWRGIGFEHGHMDYQHFCLYAIWISAQGWNGR